MTNPNDPAFSAVFDWKSDGSRSYKVFLTDGGLTNHAVSLGAWEIESRKKLYEAWLKSAGRAERCERSEREGR